MARGLLLLFTALALGLASDAPAAAVDARRQLQEGTPGTCIETHAISGYDLEDNQDQNSLQTKEGASISSSNAADYVRIRSLLGKGEYEFYFSPPSLLPAGTATSMTVELSALVANGDGSSWFVDVFDRGSSNSWVNIGDLSSAGSDWSAVALTVTSSELTDYLDPSSDNEMLVRVYTSELFQEAYIDFAQITANGSASPTPTPTDEPTAPVTAPVAAPTPEPVAPVAAPQPVTTGSGSNVVGVFMESGQEVEAGQDEGSLQTAEGLAVSPSNTASYVRIQTGTAGGEYEFYYSTPPLLAGATPTATAIVVEFSALVVDGSGASWSVEILNRGATLVWDTIGDLSAAGADWSTVALTVTSNTLTDYLDASSNDEMLVRVRSESASQLGYIDFTQITATAGGSPTPTPTDEPTAPVTAPVTAPTPEPVAPVAAPQPVTTGSGSNVVGVFMESGQEVEAGQDEGSLQTAEGLAVSPSNTASYVRIQTGTAGGEYEFYYSTPPLLAGAAPTATAIVVEFSALVVDGSGASWSVEILNRGATLVWDTIGDLSAAGAGWSTVALTVTSNTLTDYLDASSNDEMLVRVRSESASQLGYIDFTQITATAGGSPTPTPTDEPTAPVTAPVTAPTPEPVAPVAAPQPVTTGSGSNVVGVFMESGQEVEAGQDEGSLQTAEGLAVSPSNTASYVRIQTGTAGGEYEFYYSTPPLLAGATPTATAIVVEFSALVVDGSGASWSVEILNRGATLVWDTIGDLSAAGADWSTVALTVASNTLTDYLDASSNDEMLVRVRSESASQLGYIDFTQITATAGGTPTPTPTDQPTAPVTAPVAPVSPEPAPVTAPIAPPPTGSQQRWAAFAQFVPDWEDFKSKLGNSVCDPLEECRTDPACCDTSTTAVCGNGFCEEGETRLGCTEDCTHHNSVCGNGVCEQVSTAGLGSYHVNMYENEYNCPVDCLSSPNLDVSSSVTGSCFMQDSTCDNVCGDGICTGNDTCENCPRDCGECPLMAGDGICSYPFEAAGVGDCAGTSITNFITYNGEDYATIDNAAAFDIDFGDLSCTLTPQTVPAGWRLADWDASIAFELVMTLGARFDTGCLVFDEGNAASTTDGLQGDAETSCGIIPIVRYNGNRYAIGQENCASRLMIQRIKVSGSKTCPSCGNGGLCNTLTGKCACFGLWTGPTCDRAIGDYSVPAAASSWYQPSLGTTWEWQIDGAPIPGGNGPGSLYDVELYDIDYSYSSAVIADLKSKGKTVMCYVSAGTSEDFRDDINLFPADVQGGIVSFGEGDTFPDEKWLDLRRLDLVAPIMLERLDIMKAKGCDAVEWDNADLPVHDLGLNAGGQVSVSVQIAYNAWIAAQTHARGMGVAMKNNNEAAAFHVDDYDMVVNEECWINGNCNNYWPWIKAGKPILNTEYFTTRCMYCTQANLMDMSTIKKVPDLTSCRVDCKSGFDSTQCNAASVSGAVSYPIDWTVGAGAVMNEDWCPMTLNTAADECPSTRFFVCDPSVGY